MLTWFIGNLHNGIAGILLDVFVVGVIGGLLKVVLGFIIDGFFGLLNRSKPRDIVDREMGEEYEECVARMVSNGLKLMPFRHIALDNDKGRDFVCYETDVAFVTKYGVVCVEAKSHNKMCHNNSPVKIDDDKWCGRDINPVFENARHVKTMHKLLKDNGLDGRIINLVCESTPFRFNYFGQMFDVDYSSKYKFIKGKCLPSSLKQKIKNETYTYPLEDVALMCTYNDVKCDEIKAFYSELSKEPVIYTDAQIDAIKNILASREMSPEELKERAELIEQLKAKKNYPV